MRNCRILVIDDQDGIRMLVKEVLESEGYTLDLASDGEEGLTKIRDSSYDLIITDLMVPRLKGVELINELTKEHPPLQVIVISGYFKPELTDELTKLGINKYLEKPFDLAELKEQVKESIQLRSA